MILEYSDTNGGTQDVTGGPQQLWEDVEDKAAKSVRHNDYSYRSLKSAKAKVKKDDPLGKLDPQQSGSSLGIDRLAQPATLVSGDMPVHRDKRGVLKDGNGHSEIRKDNTALPEPDKGTYNGKVEVHHLELGDGVNAAKEDFARVELAMGRRWISGAPAKKGILESRTTPASNGDQNRQPEPAESGRRATPPQAPSLSTVAPATPAQQTERNVFTSPQTEEIHREKIPTSVKSISSSPSPTVGSPSTEVTTVRDMVLEAVRIIHGFSQHQQGVPKAVHSRILQTLRADGKELSSLPNLGEWSDGSMWMRVLEAGLSETQRVTIFNMLEYMGAWEWYDGQVKLAQVTIHTKRNKLVDRRGALIHVLDRMQGRQTRTEQPGKWVRGVGRLTMGEDCSRSSNSTDVSIAERNRQLQRKRINTQLSRGHKLSTKLVKELGLGILFSPNIW